MASNIKFKRSAVQNRVPTTAQLDLGELALNTYDGKLYTEINTGSATVVEIGSKLSSLVVDGANGAGGGDVVFHGATGSRDLTWDYSDNSLKIADEAFIKIGAHEDFQISHGYALGSENTLIDQTTGKHLVLRVASAFHLRSNSTNIWNYAQNRRFLQTNNTSQDIKLYFNNLERITTTNDGADIGGTGSLKLPVGTTAQRNSSPASGDIRFNSTLGSFEGYSGNGWGELGGGGIGIGSTSTNPASGLVTNRIGVGFTDINVVGSGISVTGYGSTIVLDFNDFKPGSFHRSIHNYTATAGQTTFAGLNYVTSEKQIAVYLNGARLSEATYTATSGTTVVLDVGASLGDEVEIINIHTNSDVDRKVNTYTATAGQTTFTGLSYNSKQELDVYLNGIRLASADYTATSGNTVVLDVGASVNDTVDIVSTGDGITWRSTTDASGDRFTLTNVGIGTDQTPDKLNVRGNVNIVGVLTATTLHGDGSNLTNTGSTLSEPSSGTQRLVTTSLTTGTMTSSGTGSELTFDYSNNHLKFTDNTKAVFGTGTGDLEIYHTGSGSVINDVGSGHLHLRTSGSNRINIQSDNVQLCHSGNSKLETTSTGATVTGRLVSDGLDVGDSESIRFGTGYDMNMYHDGSNGVINNSTGGFYIFGGNGAIYLRPSTDDEHGVVVNPNGSVDLYHNGTKRFETTSTGASVTGNLAVSGVLTYDDVTNVDSVGIITARDGINCVTDGVGNGINIGAGQDLIIQHNGTNSFIDNNTGDLYIQTTGSGDDILVESADDFTVKVAGSETAIQADGDGAVRLYHNGSQKMLTSTTGINVGFRIAASGDENTYVNLGSPADQWQFYTGGVQRLFITGGPSDGGTVQLPLDNLKLQIGASQDLQIYHDGSDSLIANTTGVFFIQNTGDLRIRVDNTDAAIHCVRNGAVELYHNGTKRIETSNTGVNLTNHSYSIISGAMGSTENIKISNTTSGAYIQIGLQQQDTDGLHHRAYIKARKGSASIAGKLELLARGSGGGTNRGWIIDAAVGIQANQQVLPETDSTYDLGSSSKRWSNLYADTLHGALSGNATSATTATRVTATDQSSDTTCFPLFVQATTGDLTPHTGTNLAFNSSTGALTATSFSGNGANITNVNATTLDSIDSGSFLRSDQADTTSGNITSTAASTSGILGAAYSTNYFGLKTSSQTLTSEYMIISANAATYISATSGNSVYIRYGANDSTNQLIIGSGNDALTWRGNKVFHAGNDGSGSGLDADTVDGLQASSLARSDIEETITGKFEFTSNGSYPLKINGTDDAKILLKGSSNPYIRFQEGTTDKAYIQWHSSGFIRLVNDEDGSQLRVQDDLRFSADGSNFYSIWHAGNDGSGSGLDADTLDGHQATAFLRSDTTDAQTSGSMTFGRGSVDPDSFTGSSGGFGAIGDGSGWGATGVFVHGGGTGDAAAMAHNGNKLYFGIQNGSGANSMETWLDVTPNTRVINFQTDNNSNNVQIGGNKIFHAGNDGSGSGLDADTLDGVQATGFFQQGGSWLGDLGSNGFTRENGVYMTGGAEFVLLSKSGQGHVLVDGDYHAYEAGGFYSYSSSNFSNQVGFYGDSTSSAIWKGHLKPSSNNSQDLGTSSVRWRNIYTNDLNLSNEGSVNDIDGTWGNFTIQEGEDDLFLINKRNGKKYKFNLTEV